MKMKGVSERPSTVRYQQHQQWRRGPNGRNRSDSNKLLEADAAVPCVLCHASVYAQKLHGLLNGAVSSRLHGHRLAIRYGGQRGTGWFEHQLHTLSALLARCWSTVPPG